MKLAEVCIKRPVFAIMMSLALVTLGIFSYRTLGVDLMPKTDPPNVNVQVQLPGASVEEVETTLSKPIEETLNTINGIDELRTNSNRGGMNANITFNLERSMDAAIQDVRDRVVQVQGRFPRDTLPPRVNRQDPDQFPILTLAVSGSRDPKELTEIVDKKLKQNLETLNGVGGIQFNGDRRRQIQLFLDADRLTAYGLTADQVRNAIERQNIEIPGGDFTAGPSDIALRTMGRLASLTDFGRIIISQQNGSTITFGDVGRVLDSVQEVRQIARVDGNPSVSLEVRKQSGSNTVAVVDAVMEKLNTLKASLPSDVVIVTRRDQSIFIRKSIEEIQHHLVLGSILAALVVFLFLRNFRSTIIAATAIPVSLIGTFTVMKLFGFTLNNMTLLALSLATGIVIDDAIVVLENIFRYVEEKGVTPREAAAEATSEIGLAVMATTLSLVVIFLPVVFITGTIGQYLFSFGVVSAAAILFSMFISFTLTPALCSMWLRPADALKRASKTRGFYAGMDRLYGHMLHWSLSHRVVMLLIAATVTLSAIELYPRLGQELVPDDDQGEFNVELGLPRGTSLQRTAEYFQDAEDMVRKLPEVQTVFTTINNGQENLFIGMTPLETRKISQQEMMRRVRTMFQRRYPGVQRIQLSGGTDLSGASSAGGGGNSGGGYQQSGNRLQMLLQGPEIEQLQQYLVDLKARVKTIPGVVDVTSYFEATQQELRVIVDRVRAADLGVRIDTLATNIRTLVGGQVLDTQFKQGDDQYEVLLRLDEPFRNDPTRLGNLLIPAGAAGGGGNFNQRTVRLSDVAQLKLDYGPSNIQRYNRQRQITLQASLDGLVLGDAVAAVREKVAELNMKPGYVLVFTGGARDLARASNDFVLAILLAVAFIYMVLASQFNSFVHPLTIMTSLPLSLPAGLFVLMAFHMTLNVYSAIGMLMLFGIVKKNSILQVDYTNTLRDQGMERHEALIAASHVRLRPILMTTISIVAGMLPIAFGRGAGAGSRSSMAVTIIGGQMLCLLLTLLVTPVVYSYFDDLREWTPSRLFAWIRRRATQPGTASF
ncbi:MAG: AcrB/AcrD/AcrF family protein [Acidobacteria bacterium]|nr:MAG: AcrB/AcrD/AcrF family protein [Acidobacteriota bacterium]